MCLQRIRKSEYLLERALFTLGGRTRLPKCIARLACGCARENSLAWISAVSKLCRVHLFHKTIERWISHHAVSGLVGCDRSLMYRTPNKNCKIRAPHPVCRVWLSNVTKYNLDSKFRAKNRQNQKLAMWFGFSKDRLTTPSVYKYGRLKICWSWNQSTVSVLPDLWLLYFFWKWQKLFSL